MRSLNWKLGGALLFVVVVTVALMAYLTNANTASEFRLFISGENSTRIQNLTDNLEQIYSNDDSWDDIQNSLSILLKAANERLLVADAGGVIVGDTGDDWLGRDTDQMGLENGTAVTVSSGKVGEFYLLTSGSGSGMGHMGMGGQGGQGGQGTTVLTVAEEDFLEQINSSLWTTTLIAAAVAIVLGFVLTRQFTRPINALAAGARHIADGDLGFRVQIKSSDEIGDLAYSFNNMASNLEKSEQARRRLVADIVHEVRTPLTIIEGTVEGIADGVFPPDSEHLDSIREQTVLLNRLVGDLRELSLAETGQLKLKPAPTNMAELVRRKLSQIELRAQENNIRVTLQAGKDIPDVKVDPVRMDQVISNLLTNAVRHTPDSGSITVSIRAVPEADSHLNRPYLAVSIANTGEGIAAEHLPHIFDRFYRAEPSRARSEGGSGLGLAIVKQLVEAHDGKVWAESSPGEGSTFYIALPVS
jgi:two-component system OmpR family sensor kinase